MQTPPICPIERNELPSMLSTLCCYENLFGPYHLQTLQAMAEVGVALWQHGEFAYAQPLLERAARDLGRCVGHGHESRVGSVAPSSC